MNKALLIASLAALGTVLCWSQAGSGMLVDDYKKFDWTAVGSLPPGAERHLLYEDPKTHAVQLLARFKPGYRVPSHYHTHGETLVVVRGKLGIDDGTGERVLGPGSFVRVPAKLPHSTRAAGLGACELLVLMAGPYDALGLEPPKAK